MRPLPADNLASSPYAAPTGVSGWLLGVFMARLTGEANHWTISLLDVRGDDRVLDVGCGPGVGVAAAARQARNGVVVGVDASATMVRQASRRNRASMRHGRVQIHLGDAARLPLPDRFFTKAASLNSLQFWPDPEAGIRELHRVLVPGGRAAVVLMARTDDPRDPAVEPGWAGDTAALLRAAGFGEILHRRREFGGVLHRAFLARRGQRR